MNNLPLVLVAVVVGSLGLLLFLSGGLGQEVPVPTVQDLSAIAAELPSDQGTIAQSLFSSKWGTLAFLRQFGPSDPHIHHESHEFLYTLSGTGSAQTALNSYELTEQRGLIFFAGSPVMFEQTGDEPLDMLIFLTPPSHTENVSRFKNIEELASASSTSFQPIAVDLAIQAPETPNDIESQARTIAQFAPTGEVNFVSVHAKYVIQSSKSSDRLLVVLSGSGELSWRSGLAGRTRQEIWANQFIVLPAGREYEITSAEPLALLQFTTPVSESEE